MDKIKPFKKIILWVRDNFQPKSHKITLGPSDLKSGQFRISPLDSNCPNLIRIVVDIPVKDTNIITSISITTADGWVCFVPQYFSADIYPDYARVDLFFYDFGKTFIMGTTYNSLRETMTDTLQGGCIIEYTVS